MTSPGTAETPCRSPTVSVVMSVFNDACYLRRAIESILEQEGAELEFIIVDDGSTDGSAAILDEYAGRDPRVRVIRQANAGLTRSLIRGCKEARGEFIARQDADDVSLPGRLARQVSMLKGDDRLVFVSSWADVIGPADEWVMTIERPADVEEASRLLLDDRTGPPGRGSVMMRRAAYVRVGGYRPEFYYAQDADLWLRLGEIGLLGYVPEVLYRYRMSSHSISGRNGVKQAFARLVDECREARRNGRSEEPILARAPAVPVQAPRGSRRSEAATNYFLGRNIVRHQPRQALPYLWACVRANPLHGRGWLVLGAAAVLAVGRHRGRSGNDARRFDKTSGQS